MKNLLMWLVALGIVVGGGLYYVLRIHSPARDYSIAHEEIAAWESRANKMRKCLLGDNPASNIAAEALAIRELTNNPPDFKKCTTTVSELSRGNTPDTGLKEVEDEWRGVNKAAAGLAQAFARIFIAGPQGRNDAVNDLGEALDTLDLAHANLRQAAHLDPEPLGIIKPSLPKAELLPLGTAKKAKLSAWLRPSSNGMVVLVEGSGRPAQQIVLVPGQPPKRAGFKGDVRPSITDLAWAVEAGDGSLGYGKLMADGSVDTPTTKPVGDKKGVPHVLFTLGNAANGAIAYLPDAARAAPQVALARITGGAFDAGVPVDADDYAFALDPPDRGLVAWSSKEQLRAMLVTLAAPAPPVVGAGSGAPPAPPVQRPVELGAGHTGLSCLTAKHGWIQSGEQFLAFDNTMSISVAMPGHELIACDATSLLVRQAGHRYGICTVQPAVALTPDAPAVPAKAGCRSVDLPAGADAFPALADGKVVAVASRFRVLAVWLEGVGVKYFVMPAEFRPRLLHATGKLVEVVGESDESLALVRAPL